MHSLKCLLSYHILDQLSIATLGQRCCVNLCACMQITKLAVYYSPFIDRGISPCISVVVYVQTFVYLSVFSSSTGDYAEKYWFIIIAMLLSIKFSVVLCVLNNVATNY